MKLTCYELAQSEVMPTKSGSTAMKQNGLERMEAWVNPERKAKAIAYCEQQGLSQSGLINKLLTEKLADFNPTGAH